jgi:hypothetical protein
MNNMRIKKRIYIHYAFRKRIKALNLKDENPATMKIVCTCSDVQCQPESWNTGTQPQWWF